MPKKQKLNMEEKRNLQKLLCADIETAEAAYQSRRRADRNALEEQLTHNPPPAVAKLFAAYAEARASMLTHEDALEKAGYRVQDNDDKSQLAIRYSEHPQELVAFDEETSRAEEEFTALKRDYTLRLFAGGEEARALFSTLAENLRNIQ